jgi:phosphate starvation-inducible protein PhoH and related proteins
MAAGGWLCGPYVHSLGRPEAVTVCMSEAILPLPESQLTLSLLGARDQHLREIGDRLEVAITHRDGRLRIVGEPAAVARATRILEVLKYRVERQGNVSPQDVAVLVSQALSQTDEGDGGAHDEIEVLDVTRTLRPRSAGQARYVKAMREHDLTFAIGPAGTGKTYLAVAMAVEALKHREIRKIVLVRPAVEAGESLGFLPGDMQAKINPYLRPLLDALHEMMDYERIKSHMERDVIEVVPLAYMRGRTLNNAFVILDEAQNCSIAQMKMFLTRMGESSKLVVSGDITQVDLPRDKQSGLTDAIARLKSIRGVGVVEMNEGDIVRHRLVQEIVRAYKDDRRPSKRRLGS